MSVISNIHYFICINFLAAQNTFANFLVCGVVVLTGDEGMELVVLGYESQIDIKEAVVSY